MKYNFYLYINIYFKVIFVINKFFIFGILLIILAYVKVYPKFSLILFYLFILFYFINLCVIF